MSPATRARAMTTRFTRTSFANGPSLDGPRSRMVPSPEMDRPAGMGRLVSVALAPLPFATRDAEITLRLVELAPGLINLVVDLGPGTIRTWGAS